MAPLALVGGRLILCATGASTGSPRPPPQAAQLLAELRPATAPHELQRSCNRPCCEWVREMSTEAIAMEIVVAVAKRAPPLETPAAPPKGKGPRASDSTTQANNPEIVKVFEGLRVETKEEVSKRVVNGINGAMNLAMKMGERMSRVEERVTAMEVESKKMQEGPQSLQEGCKWPARSTTCRVQLARRLAHTTRCVKPPALEAAHAFADYPKEHPYSFVEKDSGVERRVASSLAKSTPRKVLGKAFAPAYQALLNAGYTKDDIRQKHSEGEVRPESPLFGWRGRLGLPPRRVSFRARRRSRTHRRRRRRPDGATAPRSRASRRG